MRAKHLCCRQKRHFSVSISKPLETTGKLTPEVRHDLRYGLSLIVAGDKDRDFYPLQASPLFLLTDDTFIAVHHKITGIMATAGRQ